jgi:hypothetical protein
MAAGEAVVGFGQGGGWVLGEEEERAVALGQVGFFQDTRFQVVEGELFLRQDLGGDSGQGW